MYDFQDKLSEKTMVAAFGYASNSVGTVSNVKKMVELAHQAGALTVIDAVHYALHGPVDVKELKTDFLLCSAYKFFGPHIGVFYGQRDAFEKLNTYRLKVQKQTIPHRIETGTLNHEGIAGAGEAIEFIADLGRQFGQVKERPDWTQRRSQVVAGMEAMEAYEQPMARFLIDELSQLKGIRVYGPPADNPRTSTVSFAVDGMNSDKVTALLGQKGFFVWAGHFYALRLIERLGLQEQGGLVRVGLSPYNTREEIDRLLNEIRNIIK